MATFSLIIDNAFAFNLEIVELNDGFYDTLRSNPSIVICDGLDVVVGSTYAEGTFYMDGSPVAEIDINPMATKFAFLLGDSVALVQEIANENEMLVAAYSSDPKFVEVLQNA